MIALRWMRRALDVLLVLAVLAVAVTAGITLLAPVVGGRAMVIGGGSMEPAIGHGALILALPAGPGGYAVGDVVTVQQGGSTPYTHRVVRLTQLGGVPYLETKGDANPRPDPAIVPTAAVVGTVAISLPVLGYLSLVLGTAMGLAGFLALCATVLLLIWVLEELEERRCSTCAAVAARVAAGRGVAGDDAAGRIGTGAGGRTVLAAGAGIVAGAGILAGLPAFAVAGRPSRVRESGRARDPRVAVILEADRRDPRRRGIATSPVLPEEPPTAAGVDPGRVAASGAAATDLAGDEGLAA